MLEKLVFQGLIGLSFSMYLWLLAAGLTLVFGVLGVLNFAHGSFFMLGAFAAFTFYEKLGINFFLSILLSLVSVGIIGVIFERFFLRKIYNLDLPYQLILTFGFILIFDDLVKMIWGGVAMIPPMPSFLEGNLSILGRPYPFYNLFIIIAGLAVAFLLWITLEKTWWGRMIRASASDREMAGAIGVNIPFLFTTVFVFSAMLAALGGALGTPVRVVAPGIGTAMIIQAFVITVIGGLGNLKGAFVGALIVGILTSFGILLFPVFELFIIFVVMTIVLLIKPEGLFGK
ncbi:MAG: branched-chain amino acid ABC transporter permease, partial [Desulfobacterales bacterium]|jgi:branched-subunit amino acid ABC-type transport system permease component|nr:branched-chain amino acid ABC transporter permease [Desulfobacterales bacterium]